MAGSLGSLTLIGGTSWGLTRPALGLCPRLSRPGVCPGSHPWHLLKATLRAQDTTEAPQVGRCPPPPGPTRLCWAPGRSTYSSPGPGLPCGPRQRPHRGPGGVRGDPIAAPGRRAQGTCASLARRGDWGEEAPSPLTGECGMRGRCREDAGRPSENSTTMSASLSVPALGLWVRFRLTARLKNDLLSA